MNTLWADLLVFITVVPIQHSWHFSNWEEALKVLPQSPCGKPMRQLQWMFELYEQCTLQAGAFVFSVLWPDVVTSWHSIINKLPCLCSWTHVCSRGVYGARFTNTIFHDFLCTLLPCCHLNIFLFSMLSIIEHSRSYISRFQSIYWNIGHQNSPMSHSTSCTSRSVTHINYIHSSGICSCLCDHSTIRQRSMNKLH